MERNPLTLFFTFIAMLIWTYCIAGIVLVGAIDLYLTIVVYNTTHEFNRSFWEVWFNEPLTRCLSMVKAPFVSENSHFYLVWGDYLISLLYRAWFPTAVVACCMLANGLLGYFIEIHRSKKSY